MLKRNLVYILTILLFPIYIASHLFPRDKKIWVFGSNFGRRFADNPKYFFLYMQRLINDRECNDIRVLWISRNKTIIHELRGKGYEAYYIYSLKGIFYALRAGIYIFDTYLKDISFWLSGGALKINLWHGIPLKKIALDNKFDKVRNPKNYFYKAYYYFRRLQDERPYHYTISTSDEVSNMFHSAFAIRKENILLSGYPRNDILLLEESSIMLSSKESIFYNIINNMQRNQQKIVLYMPTFRASETDFWDVTNMHELNKQLAELGVVFIAKLHPMSKLHEQFSAIDYSNIINMPADFDPYPFMKLSHILITDYSSVYFDYLLLDRPIIFFPYDLQTYMSESRELYYDYNNITPGPKAYNGRELLYYIMIFLNMHTYYSDFRNLIRKRFFKNNDSGSCSRLYFEITNKILNGNIYHKNQK